jgi:hypothetical protein
VVKKYKKESDNHLRHSVEKMEVLVKSTSADVLHSAHYSYGIGPSFVAG